LTETAPPADYSDLSALFVNCTLRPSPSPSHTDRLLDVSRGIMGRAGVSVDSLRLVDHDVAPGVQPDMTDADEVDRPLERDDWPRLWKRVLAADILVVGTPIWLGERSSVCSRLVERLYAQSAITDDEGQYAFYGKVAGCLVTGNEDGVKHVGMGLLYALQHVGYTIPPQADAGWLGEIGPGPSYGDTVSGCSLVLTVLTLQNLKLA
jgi:multimeric flavodoxin WrbA